MALNDLTRISTSGIATGSTIDAPILRKDVSFRGPQVGVTSALFDSSENELNFKDNVKLTFGDDRDLQIYHDNVISRIRDQGIGALLIESDFIKLGAVSSGDPMLLARQGLGVSMMYNGNTKFETTNHGAIVTGILTATGFSGSVVGNTSNASGISTFYDLRVSNNLTVEGTTTTLDTNLIGVDRIEVGANSNSVVGVAITQSGTADLVRLYDGASQVVTVDDVGNVGIGSIVPVEKLHVSATGNPKILIEDTDSSNQVGVRFKTTTQDWITGLHGGVSSFKISKDSSFGFNDYLTINGAGNVGIGSNIPGEKLDVNGSIRSLANNYPSMSATFDARYDATHLLSLTVNHNSNTPQEVLGTWADSGGSNPRTIINASNGWKVGIGTINPASKLEVQDDASTGIIVRCTNTQSTNTNKALRVRNNSDTDNFSVSHRGQLFASSVGIGTASPSAPLHISGTDSNGTKIKLEDNNNGFAASEIYVQNGGRDLRFAAPQDMIFTKIGGSTLLYLENGNNVGIGTNNPFAKLDVFGNTKLRGNVDIDGNVGIGTDNPGQKLDIFNGADDPNIIIIKGADKSTEYAGIGVFQGNATFTGGGIGGTNAGISLRTADGGTETERLRITSDGNVGIGTNNPTQLIDVYKTTNDAVIKVRTTADGAYFEAGSGIGEYYGLKLLSGGTYKWFLGSYGSTNFQIKDGSAADGDEILTIQDGNGRVGLGTNNPVGKLHIWSTGPDILLTDSNQAADNRNWLLTGANTQILRLQAQNDSYGGGGNLFDFYRSGNNINELRGMKAGNYWFTVNNSTTRIGIGTTTPTQKLEVYSGAKGRPTFRHSSGFGGVQIAGPQNASGASLMFTRGYDVVGGGTTTYSLFMAGNTQTLHFVSGDPSEYETKTRLLLNPSGNVGIGTDNPGTKLDVFGSFQVKDGGGRQAFHVTETAFTAAQTNTGWTNTSYDIIPLIKWSWISAQGDHLYFASGGNTPPADQASMILSDQHGFKFGRSGWDGASNTNLSTEYFRIGMDGRVGIGTDHPETKYLQVGATAGGTLGTVFTATPLVAIAPDNLGGTAGNSHKIAIFGGQTTGNCSGLSIYHYRRGTGTDWTTDGFSFRQEVDNTANIYEYMNFASGNIGIGENQPNHKLHVKSANPSIALESTSTTGNTNIVFGDSDSETRGRIQYHNNGNYMRFHTNGDEALRIGYKGNMTNATGTWRDASEKFVNTLHMPQSHEGYSTTDSHSTFSVAASMWHETGIRGTSDLTTELFSTRMGGNGGIFVYVEVWFTCAIANYQGYQALWANANRTSSNDFTINNSGQEGNKLGTDTSGYFDLNFTSSGSGANERLTARVTTSFSNSYVRCLYKTTVVGHDYFIDFTTIR